MTLWTDDAWRVGALAWMRHELDRLGYDIVGAPDQFHIRPWSTIFRVPTRAGTVYFKAVPHQLAHEVRLTEWLASHFPDRVVPVLAADDRRDYMLFPEGGVRLRDVGTDPNIWRRLVVEYAQLQLLLEPQVSDLLALGVPDRRLVRLPNALGAVLPAREQGLVTQHSALCD